MKQELACWPHWEAIGLNLTSPRFYSALSRVREKGRGVGGGGVEWEGVKRVDSKISTCLR